MVLTLRNYLITIFLTSDMKKLLFILAIVLLSGCGVGNYTVSSGRANQGALSFTSAKATDISVYVDDDSYSIQSVKDKAYKTDRKIKQTAANTIFLSPGTHTVKVIMGDEEVFSKQLLISASEHRIIEL